MFKARGTCQRNFATHCFHCSGSLHSRAYSSRRENAQTRRQSNGEYHNQHISGSLTTRQLPIQPLHNDSTIWGQNTTTFDPNRFKENTKLSKSSSFRPFGGGHTLCSGRILARRSVNVLVAILLARYDLKVESEEFPVVDDSRPSPGVVLAAAGHDVTLKCTPR